MPPKEVFAHVDMMSSHGRRILKGIVRYNAALPMPWVLRWGYAITVEQSRRLDGVIATLTTSKLAADARNYACPVVNVSSVLEDPWPFAVIPDNRRVGSLAAEFLSSRLYTELAMVGTRDHQYSKERERGFLDALGRDRCRFAEGVGDQGPGEFQTFIQDLPAGTAVFAANDAFARQVVEACRIVGKSVPDDLAVIGVDVEEDQGMSAGVTLTSIDPDSERIGLEAAAMLDKRMAGREPDVRVVRVPPLRVVEQASTGFPRASDPALQAALELIHSRSGIGLKVADVVAASGLGRRTLENRFKASTGMGIDAMIRRQRLHRAEEWLRSTHLQVQEIADRCGYSDLFYFSAAFKKETGESPSAYRRRHTSL